MRREPLVYAVLLVAGLGVAFRTWTRAERTTPAFGSVQPWHEKADGVVSIEYTRPGRHVLIRRLDPDGTPYLWATADTSEFLVNDESGQRLLDGLAAPQAVRDLGVPDARARQGYGLDTARTRIVVRFRDGARELVVGGVTYYTGDRYVLARANGHAYVLPQETFTPFDDPLQMLMQHRMHIFPQEHLAAVEVRGGGRTWSMRRVGPAASPDAPAPPPAAWAPAATPQRPDPAFATFMQRLDGLWAAAYVPRLDPRTLTPVLRVDYADDHGRALGFLELFRGAGQGSSPEYYARTELTRVLVRLFPGAGDNLANDVAQGALGGSAPVTPRA